MARLLALWFLGVLMAAPVHAQPEDADGDRVRIAVLLVPTGEVRAETADGLTELLIGTIASRGGVTIIGKEELQAQLGHTDASTLECISSVPCIGRVGVQLDVIEVIAGTLARPEGRWVFNINRVDVRTGDVVARVFREIEGDLGAVADALADAVPELYAPPAVEVPPPPISGSLLVSTRDGAEIYIDDNLIGVAAGGSLRTDDLPPGQHEIRVIAPGHAPWTRTIRSSAGEETRLDAQLVARYEESINPWVWIAGGTALASLGAAIALGMLSQNTLSFTEEQRLDGEVTRAEVVDFYEARQVEAITADVLFGVSGAAAGLSFVMIFFPDRHFGIEVHSQVRLRPNLGGALLEGDF